MDAMLRLQAQCNFDDFFKNRTTPDFQRIELYLECESVKVSRKDLFQANVLHHLLLSLSFVKVKTELPSNSSKLKKTSSHKVHFQNNSKS